MFKKQNKLKSQSHRPIEDQSSHTSTADHDLPHKLRDVNNSSKVAKKEPVVVKFQDPQKRKRKLTTEDNRNNSKTVTHKDPIKMRQQAKAELKDMAKEVQRFGISGFDYKQRKRFEQEAVEKLGGRKRKDNKMPYPLYMKVQKVRKERESIKKQLDLVTGNVDAKSNKRSKKQKKSNNHYSTGHWVDRSTSSNPNPGKHKKGIYFVKS